MMIQEQYPQLKSNENFLALQSQLEGTENRISIARRDYNQAVADYNTTLRTFPQMIWASFQHAQPMQLFSATASAQTAPTVSFDTTAPPPPSGTAPQQAPGAPPPSSAALPPGQAPK
jgi:LemA protein